MSRTIRILVVGVGSIGERHARCFLQASATLRAGTSPSSDSANVALSLCDSRHDLLESMKQRYSVGFACTDFKVALASKPDAVVICTPAHLHIPMAIQAIEAGAHVLIEKPLSTSFDGVDRLLQLVESSRKVAAVAYVYRAHPALQVMRSWIQAGRFGRPLTIIAQSGQHFPLYRPAYREIYYRDRATGGGAVQDAMTHLLNAGEWLVGPVTSLASDLDHQSLEGVTVEDTVHVLSRQGNVMGCYSLNQHQAPNETSITVVCEKGTARFDFHHHRWRWITQPGSDWHEEPAATIDRDTLFIAQAQSFLNSIENETLPLCTLTEAAQSLAVNRTILTAAVTKRWETVSSFEGDPRWHRIQR
jgi:predicted dehydrogenase